MEEYVCEGSEEDKGQQECSEQHGFAYGRLLGRKALEEDERKERGVDEERERERERHTETSCFMWIRNGADDEE